MKLTIVLLAALLTIAPAAAAPQLLPAGLYHTASGASLYVGVEHELPDPAVNEIFDARTQRLYATYPAALTLTTPLRQERSIVSAPQGPLGVSLWHMDDQPRGLVILIHGNDAETREMGYVIPFFVANGINVATYDQRGTGASAGDWSLNGPVQRAVDVEAVYDALVKDPLVDAKRTGVWGFSNGGWTAPIVATQRPLAFMILRSAPAESLKHNIMYEVRNLLLRHKFGDAAIADAQHTWQLLLASLDPGAPWQAAKTAYVAAQKQPWFSHSLLPEHLTFPIPAKMASAFRNAVEYDPMPTLRKVKTPTLALFGSLDKNVDVAYTMPVFASVFASAGMTDYTVHLYPGADHPLKMSHSGYSGDTLAPERYAPGYPEVMIDWLRARAML